MNVHRQVLEDVVSALGAGDLFPICGFEEELDAGLKLRVESAQLFVH
jgi:hypothetical protein